MTQGHDLPNLLDDSNSGIDLRALVDDLRQIRKMAFDATGVRGKPQDQQDVIQVAVDDSLAISLAAEYLRRKRWGQEGGQGTEGLAEEPHAFGMARAVERAFRLDSPRRPISSLFRERIALPEGVRRMVLSSLLPAALRRNPDVLPITVFGDFHLMCLASPLASTRAGDERRSAGAHYTPSALVDYMVARTFADVPGDLATISGMRILDPSCGCGAFLIAVLRHLAAASAGLREWPSMLYGSDIDRRAIKLARLSLALCAAELSRGPAGIHLGHIAGDRRFLAQDFLSPTTWRNLQFDVVIGGPPFIRIERLHKAAPGRVREYRRDYRTARAGQFDLYMPFIEKSVAVLRAGGRLAFSVASSFLRSKSGTELRRFLGETVTVEEIVEFEDGHVYPDASVQIEVLLARKAAPPARTRYVWLPKARPLRAALQRLLRPTCRSMNGWRVISVQLPRGGSGEWPLHAARERALLAHMDKVGTPLRDLPVRISLGLCTGADDIFLLRACEGLSRRVVPLTTRDGRSTEMERAVLKPILRGRHSWRPQDNQTQFVCVFPYDEEGAVLGERSFMRQFPLAYRYLAGQKQRLLTRRLCPGQPWYAVRKVDAASHLAKPKIIVPAV